MDSILENRCRELAIAELLAVPSLGTTQQYLSNHRIVGDESGPLVAGVIETEDGADVFFEW